MRTIPRGTHAAAHRGAAAAALPTVLHVGSLPPPQGGIGTYLEGLLRSSVATEFDIDVLDVPVPLRFRKHRVLRPSLTVRDLVRLGIAITRKRPQLVHIHAARFPGFWEKALFAELVRRRGLQYVMHLHGGDFDVQLKRQTGMGAQAVSRILHQAALVIAPTRSWLPQLQGLAPRTRVVVLPNAIHVDDFAAVKRRPPARGTSHILFLGMISPRKGLDELCEALLALRQRGRTSFAVDIVGGEELPGALRHYRNLVQRLGLQSCVRFHGEQIGVHKAEFLGNADICVTPSRNESFGIVNLEAMACALAIVTTRTGAIPEYLEDGVHGLLVPPGDARALANALERLLGNGHERARLGAAAHQRVRDYDWKVVGPTLGKLYQRCIECGARH